MSIRHVRMSRKDHPVPRISADHDVVCAEDLLKKGSRQHAPYSKGVAPKKHYGKVDKVWTQPPVGNYSSLASGEGAIRGRQADKSSRHGKSSR